MTNKEIVRYSTIGIVFLFIGSLLSWFILANNLGLTKVFLPRQEAVRRETFEQSKAFVQGTTQELENMQVEYMKADKGHKQALASIILHRAASVDETLLPSGLRAFIQSLRSGRGSY